MFTVITAGTLVTFHQSEDVVRSKLRLTSPFSRVSSQGAAQQANLFSLGRAGHGKASPPLSQGV